jgi:hypothetical protein
MNIKFIIEYLKCIGFEEKDFVLKEGDSELGYFISLIVDEGHPKIGSLLGKHRKNLKALEQLIIVAGRSSDIHPYFIVRFKQ